MIVSVKNVNPHNIRTFRLGGQSGTDVSLYVVTGFQIEIESLFGPRRSVIYEDILLLVHNVLIERKNTLR